MPDKTIDELNQCNLDELNNCLQQTLNQLKQDHYMAVLMGSMGVSPKYASMYFKAMKKIREYQDNQMEDNDDRNKV